MCARARLCACMCRSVTGLYCLLEIGSRTGKIPVGNGIKGRSLIYGLGIRGVQGAMGIRHANLGGPMEGCMDAVIYEGEECLLNFRQV